jgi:NAD-dependent dihydropyrimidine dehydrogenase PreA subunit
MKTVEMKFTNSDARPKVVVINCARGSCEDIAAWYGAYFSGDRYRIEINGETVKKDQNGCILL